MSSRLLRSRAPARLVRAQGRARRSTRVRNRYTRCWPRRCASRPAVYAVWIALALLLVPMYMFSPERARAARGPGRHLRRASTSRPTRRLEQVDDLLGARSASIFASTPEFEHSFQITLPERAASAAWSLKPWNERKRSVFPIEHELNMKLGRHHRHPRARVPAAGAAQPGPVPGRVRHRLDRRARRARAVRRSAGAGRRWRAGSSRSRPSSTCASTRRTAEIVIDRDKVGVDGPDHGAGRRRPVGDARRQLRQPLQHRRAQLQGHPAGRARRAADAGRSSTTSTSSGPNGRLIPLGADRDAARAASSRAR